MVPRMNMCEKTRDDGRQPSTAYFINSMRQFSTLLTGETTYTLCFVDFGSMSWLGILPLNN